MVENKLKEVIFNFNNLCRNDKRITKFACYMKDNRLIQFDIYIKDYAGKVYESHINEYLTFIPDNDVKEYIKYVFFAMINSLEKESLIKNWKE